MTNSFDVLYIGTAILDSIIKGFDHKPISISGYKAKNNTLNIGGEAINGIISSNKLGLKSTILCHLGNDIAGDIIKNELIKNNIDLTNIIFSNKYPTPITTMFVNEDGTRKSITNNAHKYNFHPEKYLHNIKAKAIVLASLFRPPFDDKDVINDVLKYAKKNNMLVFADTKLPNNNVLTLNDLDSLELIDYISPNLDEAKYYTNENELDKMANVFLNKGIKNVIIKLGSEGVYFKNNKEEIKLPAYKIDVKDATGAGDNFLAGFVYKILEGSNNKDSLLFGNACGAICASEIGATSALKNKKQVLGFIKTNKFVR